MIEIPEDHPRYLSLKERHAIIDGMHKTIVAEAGLAHDGRLDQAAALIETAADCGANGVKFQFFNAELLINKENLEKELNLSGQDWFSSLKKYDFDVDWLPYLKKNS